MNDFSDKNWKEFSDKSLLEIIGKFIQSNRLTQNKSQTEVSSEAGVSRSTLSLLERGENVQMDSFIKILRVLDLLYVMDVFKVQEQISPIEYAKLKKKERKKASVKKESQDNSDFAW